MSVLFEKVENGEFLDQSIERIVCTVAWLERIFLACKWDTSVVMFDPISKIFRINLRSCLGYVQIRHVPKFLLGQGEKNQFLRWFYT